jgi:hypothetical protein
MDGSTNILTIPFPYLQKAHVHIFIDGVEVTTGSWSSPSTYTLPGAAGTYAGKASLVQRFTPVDEPVVVYGSGTVGNSQLNTAELRTVYSLQEGVAAGVALEAELVAILPGIVGAGSSALAAIASARTAALATLGTALTTSLAALTSATTTALGSISSAVTVAIAAVVGQQGTSVAAVVTQQGTSVAAVVTQQGTSVAAVVTQQGTSVAAVVTQQGLSTNAVITQQNTSVTLVTTTGDAQTQRVIDAALARFYPTTAAALSQGVASVAITAGGTGGANGDFDFPFTNGGGTNGIMRVRVAGGIVTTILGIRLSGWNYTSNPTTADTSSCAGLTGFTFTTTRQINQVLGTFFYVSPSSATGALYDEYEVTTGPVATYRGSVADGTIIETARRERIKRAIIEAAGIYGKEAISCLLTADGVKTYKAGTTRNEIDFIQPLLPETGLGFGQNAITYDGGVSSGAITGSPYKRPTYVLQGETPAIRFFSQQVGFTATDGTQATSGNRVPIFTPANIGVNGSWGVDYIFSMPATKATYASTAAALADAANLTVGDIVYISTGDPRPTIFSGSYEQVPADALGPLLDGDSYFSDGYYVVGSQNNIVPIGGRILTFYDSANSTTKYAMLYFNKRGQLLWYNYDGTRQGTCTTLCYDIIKLAQAGRVHLHLEKTPVGGLFANINGHDRCSINNAASYFSGTPNRMQINGNGEAPGGYEKVPLNGWPFTLLALNITQGMDYTAMRHVSDALAKIYGTPKRHWDATAYLIVVFDQSRFSGTDDASSSPHPANVSGWSLQITGKAPGGLISADSFTKFPSQVNDMAADPWYGMYAPSSTTGSMDLMTPGPIGFGTSRSGGGTAAAYTHSLNSTGYESLEWGMTRELQRDPKLRNHHFYFLGSTYGGYSLEQLAEEDLPIQELHTLRDPSAVVTKPRTINYRNLEVMARFVQNRGQTLQPLALVNVQSETFSYVVTARGGVGTRRRKEMRDYLNNVVRPLCDTVSRPPIVLTKAGAVSSDGLGISSWGNAPTWADSERMDMESLRTATDFRLIHMAGTANWCGPGIHWPVAYVRNYGGIMGDRVRREWCLNEKAGATKITNAVLGTAGNAGKLVLTVNRRLVLDIAGTDPRYPGTYHLDGLNGAGVLTYGFVFESHAYQPITFAGQPTSGDTITINGAVYTFVNVLTTGTQVQIGSTLAQTMTNFVAAVNASAEADPSGQYTAAGLIPNADAWASVFSATVVRIFANAIGTAGNAITLAKSGANITVGGATLAGADDARTIGGDVTFSNSTYTATILVPISGSGPKVGDLIKVMGTGVRFSNFREETDRKGYYQYQTWPSLPISAPGDVTRDNTTDSSLSDFLGPQKVFIQA